MTELDLKQKYDIFTAAWRFYRKWAVVPKPFTDGQWQQVIEETHNICKGFGNDDLAVGLLGSIVHNFDKMNRRNVKEQAI